MGECQRNLGEFEKARVCLELAGRFLDENKIAEKKILLEEIDALKNGSPVLNPRCETEVRNRE